MLDAHEPPKLIDQFPDGVLVVDRAGTIVAANRAALRMLGYESTALLGETLELLVDDPVRQRHADLRSAYLRDPVARRMGADRLVTARHRDGDRIDVEVSLAPLDDDGLNTLVVLHETALEVARHHRMIAQIELLIAMTRGAGIDATLQVALERTRDALHADAAWLWLRGDNGQLSMVAGADHGHDIVTTVTVDVVVDAIGGRSAVIVLDAAAPGHPLDGYTALGYGPIVACRVGVDDDGERGLLVLARAQGRRVFEPSHRRAVEEFAEIVSVALEIDRSRAALRHLAVIDDRDRIARELHDSIVQRLYADGLRLEGAAKRAALDVAEPIRDVIRDLEATIVELRGAIFAMQQDPPGTPIGDAVRRLVDDFAAPANLASRIHIEDGLDRLPAELRHQVLTALRECLANVVRHANAAEVEVWLGVRGHELVVSVIDDGVGPPDLPAVRGHGLHNLTARAAAFGGRFELERSEPTGTIAVWAVPFGA